MHSTWTAKAGQEEEFARSWGDLARRAQEEFPGMNAQLLRDQAREDGFIGFARWPNQEQVDAWQEHDAFKAGIARTRELAESFELRILDVAVEVGS